MAERNDLKTDSSEVNEIERLPIFNPLNKIHLGKSVVAALATRPLVPLGNNHSFIGAGVYSIYYSGSFPLYANSKGVSFFTERPIYVGKAVPRGARKGILTQSGDDRSLSARLNEHAESICNVDNLRIDDFFCRFLAVDDIWIPLAESLLITQYSPLWNTVVEGFGNHDPGKGRSGQMRSLWDTLHPGRKWVEKLRENKVAVKTIEKMVRSSLFSNESQFPN